MKQYIDSKQLKELTFEQVNKLGKMSGLYGIPSTEQEWEKNKQKEHLTMYISLLQWCNIGQMIELLEKNVGIDYIKPIICKDVITKVECWDVCMSNDYYGKGKELCDALFEAVKQIL
jgi:hypothetical protein